MPSPWSWQIPAPTTASSSAAGASAGSTRPGPPPAPAFHHTLGFGPMVIRDHSEVLEAELPTRLRLLVRLRPLGSAEVEFRLAPDGDGTHVTMIETPTSGMLAATWSPPAAAATRWRNTRVLGRLGKVAAGRARSKARAAFADSGPVSGDAADAVVIGAGPERPGGRQPPRRRRLGRAGAGGAGRSRRRRPHRRGDRPGLPQRPVQRLLPAGQRPCPPRSASSSRPRGSPGPTPRPSSPTRGPTARPRCSNAPPRPPPPGSTPPHPGTGTPGCASTTAGSGRATRCSTRSWPPSRRSSPAAAPWPGSAPVTSCPSCAPCSFPSDASGTRCSAATPPSCCSPATPSTPTCRPTPRRAGSSAGCWRRWARTSASRPRSAGPASWRRRWSAGWRPAVAACVCGAPVERVVVERGRAVGVARRRVARPRPPGGAGRRRRRGPAAPPRRRGAPARRGGHRAGRLPAELGDDQGRLGGADPDPVA